MSIAFLRDVCFYLKNIILIKSKNIYIFKKLKASRLRSVMFISFLLNYQEGGRLQVYKLLKEQKSVSGEKVESLFPMEFLIREENKEDAMVTYGIF